MESATVAATPSTRDSSWMQVERLLALACAHLGMDIAWLSEFTGDEQVIRAASGDLSAMHVDLGQGLGLEGSYCVRVLAGTLPPVISDARRDLITRELAVTKNLTIGSYIGVPWRDQNGHTAGMLCCLSRGPAPTLDADSERFLGLIADLISDHVHTPLTAESLAVAKDDQLIRKILASGDIRMVFQPIVRLDDNSVRGFEALARFDHPDLPTPAHAFAAASRAGLGVQLELLAARAALERLDDVPPELGIGVNLSAEALVTPEVEALLLAQGGPRVGVELTEHTQVEDYPRLVAVTDRLRAAGMRIIVDDAGAGYASLRHILQLHPGVIKLDIAIIRGVDSDPVRQALTRSLVAFSADIGASLVAEGIEYQSEHDMLRALGVEYGQGYLMARPGPLPALFT